MPKADTFLRVALQDAYERRLSLLIQLLSVWSSPEVARLVASGLQDEDRSKRAQALEALESLSERRFTRLFMPILEAESKPSTWRDLAQRQWSLTYADIDSMLDDCCQSTDKWILIGAMLSEQARADASNGLWHQRLQTLAQTAEEPDVQEAAESLLLATKTAEPKLALTDTLLFLKRIPLF